MSLSKLLVFSTVYALILLNVGPTKVWSSEIINLIYTKGFCYEVFTGSEKSGFVFEVKNNQDKFHTNTIFTQIGLNPNLSATLQILKSESDEHFTPLKSTFEMYQKNKLLKSHVTSFSLTKENSIQISTETLVPKVPKNKKVVLVEPKGLVLESQMTDLLFSRKKISEIHPKEKMAFQVFSESDGRSHQIISQLEGQSDNLVLVHQKEGETFKSTHSINGDMLNTHFKTKNITLKPCTSKSVVTHLNSALSNIKFKSLFSLDDREKIKSCCQHF